MTKEAEYSCSVTLMILGTELDPLTVSHALRMQPSQTWRKGDVNGESSAHSWGGWKRFSPESKRKQYLEQQLAYWCRALRDRRPALRKLAKSNHRCVLSCYIGTSETASIVLDPELQRAIAELGLAIEVSVWVSSNESER